MLKRLWQILGPVFCALLLALTLIIFHPIAVKYSLTAEKKDAVALTKTSFKSKYKKVRALTDPKQRFVPFFGSSELSRLDKMHPSVLAQAYHRNYRPYLLGQKGAASLTHYFGIQQISKELENKQAVYIISPQWFVPEGANSHAFQNYFSSSQFVDFLQNQTGSPYDRYAAKRFLQLYPDSEFKPLAQKTAKGKEINSSDQSWLALKEKMLAKEDAFFSDLSFFDDYKKKVLSQTADLPSHFSYAALKRLATEEGEKSTSNNRFGIENTFYSMRVQHQLKRLQGSQKYFDYIKSPEYNDLQLVLDQFAKTHTNVLFVIPPVNSKWAAFTGLNQTMYQKAVAKIKYQLQSQGFTNIADFSKDGSKPYFMQDTIHIGWNGWLALDKEVNSFLSKEEDAPAYTINNRFLNKDWANFTGQPDKF
ncbi:D-alanyl-lipoteichoic acid biosynthesis protein DltD [Streptococcus caviae]|uniref:D-alanyl-lipoteichoic acid biosynthesis protein DltD n=1 Tax=Streptococcus sp. 'caviae' TaxID=1915004 RepID=UPI00094B9DDE|nr:D-alanyl-lipoteichoic acid biosynthesis protein DltD [Streptococcus sp. 'caviae']OLN83776.1 D-alanyl-lipoteichoic acid biosynthesis protein DltD [Streptococcus sp. 'caviae']